jgi:hypothetical protein
MAITILPPLSLITALLVYFSWVRQAEYVTALGLNVNIIEQGPLSDRLLRSVDTVYFPLLIASIGFFLWLQIDRVLRRWAGDHGRGRVVFRVSWALPVSAVTVTAGTVLLGILSPTAAPYVSLVWPFLAALTILATAYGASLRRLVGRKATGEDNDGYRWASNAVIGLFTTLLLFHGMDGFAKVVGNGLAQRIIDYPSRFTQAVQLYSAQDLQLDPDTAIRQELPGGERTAYHYRYEGLRLIFVDASQFFLIGRTWQTRGGPLIVLPRDGIRIEFKRSGA